MILRSGEGTPRWHATPRRPRFHPSNESLSPRWRRNDTTRLFLPRWLCRVHSCLANASENNQCPSVLPPSERRWKYGHVRRQRRLRYRFGHFRWPHGHDNRDVRPPAWGFLQVFYSNHSPIMHRYWDGGIKQTDERTKGRITALLKAALP